MVSKLWAQPLGPMGILKKKISVAIFFNSTCFESYRIITSGRLHVSFCSTNPGCIHIFYFISGFSKQKN